MNKEQALQVLSYLHNTAISKGLYNNVAEVNQVTLALQTLTEPAKAVPTLSTDGEQ